MKWTTLLSLLAVLLAACSGNNTNITDARKTAIEAIKKAESDFAKMAAEKGVAEAFYFYADSNAVIKRENDSLVHGRDGIRNYYSDPHYASAKVSWSPDFTDASANGDFGYTYGRYSWVIQDSAGKSTEYKGVFHTVWKKQADGNWKYVWD
ncbi:MAG TPA: DUF4440 domain-containing protein [Chitinophagaceae bacterium]|nr:DUF4440 domain-containing protein [Chitinophagaceae bacterium]